MKLYVGDLVRIKSYFNELGIITQNERFGQHFLYSRKTGKLGPYDPEELELVERGHYGKLFSPEEKQEYENSWKGEATLP